jgi:hypothetical protein
VEAAAFGAGALKPIGSRLALPADVNSGEE